MRSIKIPFLMFAFLFSMFSAEAKDGTESFPRPPIVSRPELVQRADNLIVIGVSIGSARRSTIERKLGKSTFLPDEEARTSNRSQPVNLCYLTSDSAALVVFTSTIGSGGRFTDVEIKTNFKKDKVAKCRQLKETASQLKTNSRIGIGSTRAEVFKILGEPVTECVESCLWNAPLRGAAFPKAESDFLISIKVGFENDMVTRFSVSSYP